MQGLCEYIGQGSKELYLNRYTAVKGDSSRLRSEDVILSLKCATKIPVLECPLFREAEDHRTDIMHIIKNEHF